MKPEYQAWIREHVGESYGKCADATEAMLTAFPELLRVRGHYYCSAWGERAHWWLVDTDGNVIDPTASQFPSKGSGEYVPWDESRQEPTGRCPNCGGHCYNWDTCCSDKCGVEYVAFCSRGL